MTFNKRFYNKKSVCSIAKYENVDMFITYFRTDGYIFEDKFSEDIYHLLLEALKKPNPEMDIEIRNIMNVCKNS